MATKLPTRKLIAPDCYIDRLDGGGILIRQERPLQNQVVIQLHSMESAMILAESILGMPTKKTLERMKRLERKKKCMRDEGKLHMTKEHYIAICRILVRQAFNLGYGHRPCGLIYYSRQADLTTTDYRGRTVILKRGQKNGVVIGIRQHGRLKLGWAFYDRGPFVRVVGICRALKSAVDMTDEWPEASINPFDVFQTTKQFSAVCPELKMLWLTVAGEMHNRLVYPELREAFVAKNVAQAGGLSKNGSTTPSTSDQRIPAPAESFSG